jgi:hypothetical protein
VRFVWAIVAALYALLSVYVGYLFVTAAVGEKLTQKGLLLQAPPLLGGIALVLFAIPLLWNCASLAIRPRPSAPRD